MSKKIFLFTCVILLIIIVPLFYITRASLTDFGLYAYDVNEKQIRNTSSYFLSHIADEQAQTYDQGFEKIITASSIMGRQLTQIYRQMENSGAVQPQSGLLSLYQNPETGIYYSHENHDPIVAFWGGQKLTLDIENEIKALSQFFPTLTGARERLQESLAAHVITQSGIGLYSTSNQTARNACFYLPRPEVFDLREGEPVTIFTSSQEKQQDTRWTRIYKDDVIDGLMMTATTPVYDSNGQLLAITGIDLPVGQIIQNFVRNIPGDKENVHTGILFSFLVNRNGNIIALPKEFMSLFKLDIDMGRFKNSGDIFDYSLLDSGSSDIREAGKRIIQTGNKLIELHLEGETYLLAVGILDSVQWRLVLVAKESEMLASLGKTKEALNKSLDKIWVDFVGHGVLIAALCILIVFTMIRIFISPIRNFIEATQRVTRGDLSMMLEETSLDELGQMARSFNQMVKKLKISDSIEKKQARELERLIQIRTSELQKTNEQLNLIKHSLEKTVAKRTDQLRELNEYLVNSEEMERKEVASDLHDSVTQTLAMAISKLKDTREDFEGKADAKLSQVQVYLEQSIREVRALIYKLSPPVLDDFDITLALGFLIEDTNEKHGAELVYENHVEHPVNLEHTGKVTIYRAVNELIHNILKHSGAVDGRIEIFFENQTVKIIVADQGCGFEPRAVERRGKTGYGLRNLIQRIENFQGNVKINSGIGRGTHIVLTLPVKKPEGFNEI